MKTRFLYGGMATAMVVVLTVATYRTAPVFRDESQETVTTTSAGQEAANDSKLAAAPADPRLAEQRQDGPAVARKHSEDVATAVDRPEPTQPVKTSKERTETAKSESGQRESDIVRSRETPAGRDQMIAAMPKSDALPGAEALAVAPPPGSQGMPLGGIVGFAAPTEKLSSQSRSLRIAPHPDQPPRPGFEATGRDQFEAVDESPVKQVLKEPVSTFSADVDTASYAFVRRMLMRGTLPQKNAVRVEEMINYFDYDYPLPTTREQPFQPTVTVTPSPWKDGNKLIHIGIKGYDIEPAEKPRSNLVFLLDVSGSMNARDKLPLMVNSMKLLLDSLNPDDTVAIAVYAGAAGTVLEPTPVAEKQKILAALDNLRAGGSTAGAAGIRNAYALAEGNFDKDAVNRVILATDGDFNVGITNREELKGFIERKRKSGIFLSVLGFGQGNLNDALMQKLAQNGNGVAAHIDTLNEARKVLVDEATGMLFPIAKDVKIQVEFNPKTVSEYRLIGYETRALKREDFRNDKVDAGDIGAGHTVTAIYEITPVDGGTPLVGQSRYGSPQTASGGDFGSEYGFLKIRYKLPTESTSKLITAPIPVAGDGGRTPSTVAREARWASAVAAFGQLLRGGTYTGDFTYADIAELARGAKGEDPFGYRAEFVNLVRIAKSASAMPKR